MTIQNKMEHFMEHVIIIRYAEIHLKGKNRGYFERAFAANMEKSLRASATRYAGRAAGTSSKTSTTAK